jgi:transposase
MAKLLMTVPGIGYYSALLIVSEVGDINRFPDSYHLCSYAGLIPYTVQVG